MDKKSENELVKNLLDGAFYVDQDRKITFWNRSAERISGYSADAVVGMLCCDKMLECVNSEGERLCDDKCPLATTMSDGTARELNIYLHHKKGHRVPVTVRTSVLRGEDGEVTGCVETFVESYSQSQVLQELWQSNESGMTDSLIGIGNERFFEINLSTRLFELNTFNVGFGVVLIDLDQFGAINTTYGTKIGDEVLTMIGRTLSGVLRKLDMITRGKNDEFIIIVPNMPPDILKKVAERLRILVKNSFILSDGHEITVTASLGATLARPGDTQATMIERLHKLVDRSKNQGRDQVMAG
jgi:diguanylate cyclase (GGDEF)-like protein/PAS domain S-box-containing protein